MIIKFQGVWEAELVARMLETWTPENGSIETWRGGMRPWRDDCTERMRCQIARERERRNGERDNKRTTTRNAEANPDGCGCGNCERLNLGAEPCQNCTDPAMVGEEAR